MNTIKRKDVENTLSYFKESNPELKPLTLFDADARCGKRVALAEVAEAGTVAVKTDFMSYTEMNQFLYGYSANSRKIFNGEQKQNHVLVTIKNGIVSEIWSEKPGVKVTVLDIDDNADDPIHIQDEEVQVPQHGIQKVIEWEEQQLKIEAE